MVYLYESHLGGIYATDQEEEWENLYCEQCGDSDRLIGAFNDTDVDGAWNAIKPGNICCIGCEKESNCFSDCEKVEEGGTDYGIGEMQNFLCGTFHGTKQNKVYLICRDEKTGEVFVNCNPIGHQFGEVYQIPELMFHHDELAEKIAITMKPLSDDENAEEKSFKLLDKRKDGKKNLYIYEYVINQKLDKIHGASYGGGGWYGWVPVQCIVLPKDQGFLREYLQEKNNI